MLLTFIGFYLLASVFIGLYAARRVKTTADYAVAGRSLPLAVVIATTFATWFGSETVLGGSAKLVAGGVGSPVAQDLYGAEAGNRGRNAAPPCEREALALARSALQLRVNPRSVRELV